jgi:hypothetical protein
MATVVAIFLGLFASAGYAQESPAADDAASPANQFPPAPYANVGLGYKIAGQLVVAAPAPFNLAVGESALVSTSGVSNTAIGYGALQCNSSGNDNIASGYQALNFNTTGSGSTAIGFFSLLNNTTGSKNTATGIYALSENSNGSGNTASGFNALAGSSGGSNNSALGAGACQYVFTGSNVTCIGANFGPASDVAGPATYIAGIWNVATSGADNLLVCVDSAGQLGTQNCATSAPSELREIIERQQARIEELQKQNEEFQQRLSRLESLIAGK